MGLWNSLCRILIYSGRWACSQQRCGVCVCVVVVLHAGSSGGSVGSVAPASQRAFNVVCLCLVADPRRTCSRWSASTGSPRTAPMPARRSSRSCSRRRQPPTEGTCCRDPVMGGTGRTWGDPPSTRIIRADSRFAPSQWETALQSNAVSHWLGASLESVLIIDNTVQCHYNTVSFLPNPQSTHHGLPMRARYGVSVSQIWFTVLSLI